jgi:hypothetical protein
MRISVLLTVRVRKCPHAVREEYILTMRRILQHGISGAELFV